MRSKLYMSKTKVFGTHVLTFEKPNVLTTVGINEVTAPAVVLVVWMKPNIHIL